ncbi:MAG: amino acid permease [Elusimicrobia bacterium]|nr:amino acid permease [Elusimicrobiota bacterium]
MSDAPETGLKRELGLFDSTMIVAGSMIGSGIFIVSADIARTVGGAGWLLLVWLITGIITVTAAVSYGELAGMIPKAGGQYVYLREAYGPLAGFLYGWTLFLVIQTGTIAAVAVAFAKYTGVLFPWFSEQHILFAAGRFHVSAAQLLAIAVIAFLTWLNLRGLKLGKIVQNIFTVTKIASLVGLALLVFYALNHGSAWNENWRSAWQAVWRHGEATEPLAGAKIWAAVGVAMVGSLFSAVAWENITYTAGEVRRPERDIALSLAMGTALVSLLYILANVTYLAVLPMDAIQAAPRDRVASAALSALFGDGGGLLMAALIMVSTFGCNNGLILSGARVYYAMSQHGLFFERIGTLNKNAVPGAALVLQGVWAGLLCLSGAYGDLLDYVVVATLVFYGMTVAGIFVLRVKRPDAPRPYRAWGYPVVPAFYILACAAISLDLLIYKPAYTWPGLGIVLLGIPVYFLRKRSA